MHGHRPIQMHTKRERWWVEIVKKEEKIRLLDQLLSIPLYINIYEYKLYCTTESVPHANIWFSIFYFSFIFLTGKLWLDNDMQWRHPLSLSLTTPQTLTPPSPPTTQLNTNSNIPFRELLLQQQQQQAQQQQQSDIKRMFSLYSWLIQITAFLLQIKCPGTLGPWSFLRDILYPK